MTPDRSPLRLARLAKSFAVVLAFTAPASGQTNSAWNGSTGNWTDIARWNTPNFPNNGNGGLNYSATIGGGGVILNQNITINALTMTGGSILAPSSGGPFVLIANNGLSWTGSTFGSGQTLRSNGVATINNATLGGTFENTGTVSADGLNGTAGAVVNNLAGAIYTGSLFGNGTFNNQSGATYTSNSSRQFEWGFNNQAGGLVTAANATLQFRKPGTHSGAFNLTNSALQYEIGATQLFGPSSSLSGNGDLLSFDAAITIQGSYSLRNTWIRGPGASANFQSAYGGTGELRIDPGAVVTLQLPTTLNDLWLNGGTLAGPGRLTMSGPWDFEISGTLAGTSALPHRNLSIGTLNYAGTKTFAHNLLNESGATIRVLGGDVHIAPGVTVTNRPGGLFIDQADGPIGSATQPNGALINQGTFSRRSSTGTAVVYSEFTNTPGGLVDVQTGTLNLANPGKLFGTFNIASGATLAFSGAQTLAGNMTFTGTGTIAAAGGVTTINGTLTHPNFALTGGILAGNGRLAVSTLTFSGGTIGRNLELNATSSNQFTGGTLTIGDGQKVNILPGATLQAAGGTIAGSDGSLNNFGTLNKSGSGALILDVPFRNYPTGRVVVQSGTVQINNPSNLGGLFDLTGLGTVLALNGNTSISNQAAFTGPGVVQASQGTTTLNGNVTIPNFTLNGGTLAGTGTLLAANLVLNGGTINRDFSVGGTMSNQVTGGTLSIGSGYTLVVPAGLTLSATQGMIAGPGLLANLGTFSKTGSATLTVSAPFANLPSGVVQVQGGTLSLTGGENQGGAFVLANGTTLSLGSFSTIGSDARISGAGQVQVAGVNVLFTGAGNHSYTGGTVLSYGANALATGTGAAFGTTNVTVENGGVLRLSATGNLAAGTTAVVSSGATIGLENSFNPAPIIHSTSAGVVGINIPNFATPLNLATLGNSLMSLGSSSAGTYTAPSLGAGSGNVYRLGGGGGVLTLAGTNVLAGNNSVLIGAAGPVGTVVLAAANNYTGPTTVANATLAVGHGGALGSGTLNLNGGTIQASGAAVALANPVSIGGNVTLAGSHDLTLSGNVTLTGDRTLTTTGSGVSTISGNIAGDIPSRSLTKAGPGILTLSGNNTYGGGTTVSAGTLRTSGFSQSLGQGNVNVSSDASLRQASFNNLGAGATVLVMTGGVLGLDGNFPPTLDNTSTGIVGINTASFSQPLSQSTLGNGQMFLGSQANGQYNAATLIAGSGNLYRLGGGGGTLTIPTANLLTGFAGLQVGSTQSQGPERSSSRQGRATRATPASMPAARLCCRRR